MEIYFVTGNKNKFNEAKKIVGRQIKKIELDLEEIQSDDIYEIVKNKAKKAFEILKEPIFVEDVAFYLKCLNQFPGPNIKWMVKSVGVRGIYKLVKKYKEKKVLVRAVVCYFNGNEFKFFTGDLNGKIVFPKGNGFGFDPIVLPKGEKKTMGQLGESKKNEISHRALAWKKVKAELF